VREEAEDHKHYGEDPKLNGNREESGCGELRNGELAHRIGGWIWVVLMSAVAGVSFAIHGPNGYSWIHILSAITLISLVCGVLLARAHRVQSHRFTMISIYFGALLIAGAFTLLPSRLIGRALWGWW
jgi:uncharacterized membrane protein